MNGLKGMWAYDPSPAKHASSGFQKKRSSGKFIGTPSFNFKKGPHENQGKKCARL
jgi:hypothetical protein